MQKLDTNVMSGIEGGTDVEGLLKPATGIPLPSGPWWETLEKLGNPGFGVFYH